MLSADQLLARLYALRKDYADNPEDETYQALHHAFMFISYQMAAFKQYVEEERTRGTGGLGDKETRGPGDKGTG